MEEEKLMETLKGRVEASLNAYKADLMAQPPDVILSHAYDYIVREEILTALESNDLTTPQAEALLKLSSPLENIYQAWGKQKDRYIEEVGDFIERFADDLIRQEEELRKSPVYKYPGDYARENGELEQFRTSLKANLACAEEIGATISKYHDGYHFESKAAVRDVVQKFGYERTLFVLAATVQNNLHDGRYSSANKDWAMTAPVFDSKRSFEYAVRSHPVLVDAFLTTARHEYLLSLPLTKEDIKAEALNILCKFQDTREPNSPNGTHYMAQISPDFLARAKTKDTDRLMAMLPFQSLSFSTLEGRRGTYALITRDENRFQKLVLRKPSVRKKLQQPLPDSPTAAKKKTKEQER
jgi:hypothetical protein